MRGAAGLRGGPGHRRRARARRARDGQDDRGARPRPAAAARPCPDGGPLRGLSARFPDGVHTHTQEQRFYFGSDGLLRRHDYEVDIWANTAAAHFLSDYVEVNGFKFPAKRRVHPRASDGTVQYGQDIVSVDLSDYVLR